MTGFELFIKVGIYTSAILLPLAILALLGILFFKYGVGSMIQTIADKLDYIVDKITEDIRGVFNFIITEFLRIVGFFLDKATEVATLINVALIYQHPPRDQVEYIAFCTYLIFTTVVLLKKGNINIEKITDDLKEIAIKKMSVDKKSTTEEHKEYEIK